MTRIPQFSGKTTLGDLDEIPRRPWTVDPQALAGPCLMDFEEQGFRFDALWSPKPGAERLFVLFSGDALRSKNDPPVFQRWSWAPHFPGHCLYFSDPALYLADWLGLAWYAGTAGFDVLPPIARAIEAVLAAVGLGPDRAFAYGSSGGGFAALRLAAMMPGTGAVAINPQTVVPVYERKTTEMYLRLAFDRGRKGALRHYPERLSLLELVPRLQQRRLIYIQNTLDPHHYEKHYLPFCAAMGAPPEANETEGGFRRLLFAHEKGHVKAETPAVFGRAMQIVQDMTSGPVARPL